VNAKEKDVTINTIFCGDYQVGINTYWKDGAALTNGDYLAINQNQRTVHIASPYDDAILILNQKLNKTYIIYGSKGEEKMALQKEQDNNAQGYSKVNAVSRTISKSSHLYKNKSWDLVDAEEDKNFKYDDLKKEELHEELKGKSATEIKTYVSLKRAEREAIQKEIQDLNAKRKDYIAKQNTQNTNGLENAMTKAIKEQAKKKQYTWD